MTTCAWCGDENGHAPADCPNYRGLERALQSQPVPIIVAVAFGRAAIERLRALGWMDASGQWVGPRGPAGHLAEALARVSDALAVELRGEYARTMTEDF